MKIKFLLLATIAVSIIFGCTKAKQNKLTGSWDLLPQTYDQQNTKVVYEFGSDNILYRITNDSIIVTANYEIKKDFLKYYLVISNLDPNEDANYYIEKLNKKILVLQSQSPYLRKEFTKHQ